MLSSSSLLVKFDNLQRHRNTFLEIFHNLNVKLLLYIPGQPENGFCSFPALLRDYDIILPEEIQEKISSMIHFPSQEGLIPEKNLVRISIPDSINCKSGQDICLQLHRHVTLNGLSRLLKDLAEFMHDLTKELLEMLIFFKLNRSVLFDKYLRHFLKNERETRLNTNNDDNSSELTISDMISALKHIREFVNSILTGSATHSEITFLDNQMLQQLKIEREFSIFSKYAMSSKLPCDGLNGVQCMIELFQYCTHIENIKEVCDQYHLTACVEDSDMRVLLEIVKEHSKEEVRSKITLREATNMVEKAREKLCLNDKSLTCLDVFTVVRESSAFYQFVKDKQFFGTKGQATFHEQHQLITAQLQHEEYDETVLNHLVAAYKIITPFMDCNKKFSQLMTEVTSLNVENMLKQLQTVNSNITLIRLWFSRAKVSLHCINVCDVIWEKG